MSNERLQILNMLKEGKITVEEAEKLLAAVEGNAGSHEPKADESKPKKTWKYLRITEDREPIEGKNHEKHINIRIPLVLLRAGANFHAVLPENVREKIEKRLKEKVGGIGMNLLDSENMELIAQAIGEDGISIEIDQPHKKIRVFCE